MAKPITKDSLSETDEEIIAIKSFNTAKFHFSEAEKTLSEYIDLHFISRIERVNTQFEFDEIKKALKRFPECKAKDCAYKLIYQRLKEIKYSVTSNI